MQVPDHSPVHSDRVPDELMQQLHDANARFHESRQHLEASLSGSEYRHVERVAAAQDEVRQAEREVERIEQQIQRILTPDA